MSTPKLDDEEESRGVSNIGQGRFRSVVWNHYKKQKINGEEKAICNYCNRKLVGRATDGTRHLHDHLKTCPKRKQKDIKQFCLKGLNTSEGKNTLEAYTYDPDVTKKEIASMIILHEYPLSAVEHEGFRRVCKSLNPLFKPMSRNTIKKENFQIYELERAKTISLVTNTKSKIAITTDMWTASNQMRGYMAVTAHFIDDSWSLQSRILRFIYVPCPHTAVKLCDVLFRCLIDLNIDRKLSALTVDSCSTNDLMVTYLLDKLSTRDLILGGQLFHMRCCAHILNLIVKDGLDVIGDGIERIRGSVAYWTATQKRVEKFKDAVKNLNISVDRKLSLDCKTRWNSTYLMLTNAIPYMSVFSRLKQREPQYRILPTEQDWELAIILEENLKFFMRSQKCFLGVNTLQPIYFSFMFVRLDYHYFIGLHLLMLKSKEWHLI